MRRSTLREAVLAAGRSGYRALMRKTAAGLAVVAMAAGAASAEGATVVKAVSLNTGARAAMYVPVTINGQAVLMLVDTGATNTQVDRRLVKRLNLKAAGKAQTFGTVGCKTKARPYAALSVRVGGAPSKPFVVNAGRQAGKLRRVLGLPVAGLLGNDVLSTFNTISVDFADRRLVLGGGLPRTEYNLRSKALKDKKTGRTALFGAQVRIKKRKAVLIVDTGASQSTLSRRAARRFKLRRAGKSRSISAVACRTKVQPFRLPAITSGGTTFNPTVALGTKSTPVKGAAGLLGAPSLANYGQVSFDYRSGAIALGFPSP